MSKVVDIIIPTYKPDRTFRLLLQRLQEQTFVIHKLIIANTDQRLWEEYAKENEIEKFITEGSVPIEVFHVKKEEFDHGGTRRLAVERSQADYFICMTQDAMPADRYLVENLIKLFTDKSVAAVYGCQLSAENCSQVEKFTRKFNYPDEDMIKSKKDMGRLGIKTFFCSNVCAAYQREIYEELGGFEQHTIFNEDMIFGGHAILAGFQIAYSSKAKVIHSHNYTGMQQLRRNFDLAVSQKQHPEVFGRVKSESEGLRLVKMTMQHLLTIKKPWLIVDLVLKSGFKLLGYKAGLKYKRMSKKTILKLTMNQGYWLGLWEDGI